MVVMVAKRFPQLRFGVLADHLYNGRSVLHAVLREVDNVSIITRGRAGLPYRSLPGRLVRYVIVKDPDGIYRTDYILCTDTELDAAEILAAY